MDTSGGKMEIAVPQTYHLNKLDAELKTITGFVGCAGLSPVLVRVDFSSEPTQQQQDQATAIVAAHDPTNTEQAVIDTAKSTFDQFIQDFNNLAGDAKVYYQSLTPAQRQETRTTLQNWGSATAAQKADALLRLVAMAFIAIDWLIRKALKSY